MPEVVDSFETPGGNRWEKRVDARGIEYAVASHKSNKQKISSFNAAKAGAASAEAREEKYGTSQPGENEPVPEPEPVEPDEPRPPQFPKHEVDTGDRSRTSPFDDLLQRKQDLEPGIPLDVFKEEKHVWATRMAEVQNEILERHAEEYWTHANWGIELTVESDNIEVKKAVSTKDLQANIVDRSPGERYATYHPRHQQHPTDNNTEPGTYFRFTMELVPQLNEQEYENSFVTALWVETLKYPSDSEEGANS